MEVTAWYDDSIREKALKSFSEIYYYMLHATELEERRKWAMEYTRILVNDGKNATQSV